MYTDLVLGLGNILLKDEGFGVYVAKALARHVFSSNVEIMEGFTSGISLAWELENRKKIIVIDAINADKTPGTVFRFMHTEVKHYYTGTPMSLHQLDFIQTLEYAGFLGIKHPDILFFGIQPADISLGLELTAFVKDKVPVVTDLVKAELLIN
jgi:hydrogenase maturation protease